MTKNELPETGFLRLPDVLKLIPICKSSWWDGIKKGWYPKPIRLHKRSVGWRVEDIRQLIQKLSEGQ